MDDRIERDITISAPLERVWDLVTEPGWWVPSDQPTPIDRRPSAVTVRESERYGRFSIEVVQIQPQTYAACRWASAFPGEQELRSGRTTLVEFHVEPVGDAVRVRVVESGFASLDAPAEVRQTGIDGNRSGWEEMLSGLQHRSEAGSV
jgi:uncharacterized protein YndB with AHSA1/START domain